jgi:DNA-binding response OmpR family regulator
MRILVVEDEKELAFLLRRGLTQQGYSVDIANDGEEGRLFAEGIPYDVIVLDIMLPKIDGFELCSVLRRKGIGSRILMLTARDKIGDKIRGLDCGADDYLVKPFDMGELYARIRTILRRELSHGSPILNVGDLVVNTATREVTRGSCKMDLVNKEYALIEYMAYNAGIVVTRKMIEEHIWNLSLDSDSNVIEVHMNRLRTKLKAGGKEDIIETVRGAGYRLRVP